MPGVPMSISPDTIASLISEADDKVVHYTFTFSGKYFSNNPFSFAI